jgi:hypothetical protein
MAETGVIVRLSLRDAASVQRGLEQLGSQGQRALKRIEDASRASSPALRALTAASDEVRSKLGSLSAEAGTFGQALNALGPYGLAAAAGLGAAALVLGKMIELARESGEFFAKLADDAARAGTSASKLATLQGVFIANAASADEANSALVRLRAKIDAAVSGNEKAKESFEHVGISMDWLRKNGGDTVDVLLKIAQHGGLTAGQMNDLTGKIGNALVPAMQEFAKVGVQSNKEFDDLTNDINESKDKIELLDRQMTALGMGGAKDFLEAVVNIKQGLVDLTGWFLRTADANAVFWQHLAGASVKDWLWGDPIKDALNARNVALENLKKKQEEFQAIVAGQVKTEQGLRNTPKSTPYAGSITTPRDKDAERTSKDEADKAKKLQDELFKGMQDAETKSYVQWYDARSDQQWEAFVGRFELAKKESDDFWSSIKLGAQTLDVPKTKLQEVGERLGKFGDKLTSIDGMTEGVIDGLANIGSTAMSSFGDALMAGEDLATTLDKLGQSIAKTMIQLTLQMALQQALGAGAKALGSWLGGGNDYAMQMQRGEIPTYFAKGGVVGADLPHGVYSAPTVFPFDTPGLHPFARGVGLLGEAGPEAVMPLRRLPSGDLGVAGGGSNVTVNVINNAGAQVTTEQKRDPRGGLTIDVMIDAVEQAMAQRLQRPGTTLNRALSAAANPVRAR